jgi:alpha-tubulin suppressor-like RCC1 family protein
LPAIAITGGFLHTCALISDGSVQCWGDNAYGELGIGSITTTGIQGSAMPVPVVGLPAPATAIASLNLTTCALLNDGSVWCWGGNSDGQLGTSSGTVSPTPLKIALSGKASSISAGDHVCAVVSGSVWCWGDNSFGELGNGQVLGNTGMYWTPTPQKVSGLSGVSTVSVGGAHTCALAGGSITCWGHDNYGQLGNNMVGGSAAGDGFPTPQAIGYGGGGSAVAITSGFEHSCMIDSSANVYCWGENDQGAVGDNNSSGANVPVPTYVSNNISAPIAIVAGGNHTCAINLGGGVVCWGDSTYGQLGDAATTYQWLPEPVVGLSSQATGLALGGEHTCALVKNGSVWCWGANFSGGLGNGTVSGGPTPTQVLGW